MDNTAISQKFETFLRSMGYKGKIPQNFRAIYNPSTALLWDQLMNNVQPRSEIQRKRNNIIINRLSFNKENITDPNIELFKDESKYEIKEIEVWNKKQNVTRQYNKKLAKIEELKATNKNIEEQNNMKNLYLENEQQKLFETKKFVHLLNRKVEEIENEILDIETKLALVRNLTPVEESKDNTEVLELLKKCSEKLENLIPDESEASKQSKTVLDDSLGLLGSLNFNDSATLDANLVQSSVVVTEDHNCGDLLSELLYKNNRLGIFNALLELKNLQKFQLNEVMAQEDIQDCSKKDPNNAEAITKLYGTHVDSRLQIIQTENFIKNKKAKLDSLDNILWQQLINQDVTEQQRSNFKAYVYRQRREIGIESVIKYLQNFINSIQSLQDEEWNLQKVTEEARLLNNDIMEKRNCLEEKVEMFISLHDSIPQIQNNTVSLIQKLNQFTCDLKWIALLIKSISSIETDALVKFPLEYNAKVEINEKTVFVRDLPLNHIPYEENQQHFTTIFNALHDTWNPAETLVMNIFKSDAHMRFYKSLMTVSESKEYNKYTIEELQKQESIMFFAIEKLKTLFENISRNTTQEIINSIETNVKVWLEMPFKEYVSKSRLFNSLPYEHYDKLYESFYMQL